MPVQSKYEVGGSSSTDYENITVKFSPHVSVEAEIGRIFGNDSYGHTIGFALEDVELIDGALYYDSEKDKYKFFGWADAAGMTPEDAVERGIDFDVDEADDMLTKTYFGNQKTYDLVAARVDPRYDDDGNAVVEASAKSRSVDAGDDSIDLGEYEYTDDPVALPDTISWFDGSDENGPSVATKDIVHVLTAAGGDLIDDDNVDDIDNWLEPAAFGPDNLMRDDLEGRRLEMFLVRQQGEDTGNYYNSFVALDAATGERVYPNNRDDESNDGDSGNDDAPELERDAVAPGAYPEPVADYINSVKNDLANVTVDRAERLLDDMVDDPQTALTEDDIEDAGGKGAVIQEAVN